MLVEVLGTSSRVPAAGPPLPEGWPDQQARIEKRGKSVRGRRRGKVFRWATRVLLHDVPIKRGVRP